MFVVFNHEKAKHLHYYEQWKCFLDTHPGPFLVDGGDHNCYTSERFVLPKNRFDPFTTKGLEDFA